MTMSMNNIPHLFTRIRHPLPLPLRSLAWVLAGLQLALSVIPPAAIASGLAAAEVSALKPAENSAATPEVFVNRTEPDVTPPGQPMRFSTPPTTQEIFRSHAFAEPLVPTGEAGPIENQALVDALQLFERRTNLDNVSPITEFLSRYPQSVWRVSLLTDLGIVYRKTGYFSKALAAWQEAWELGQGETSPYVKATSDRAVAEWAELNARVGRIDALVSVFNKLGGRQFSGPALEKITAARTGLWEMQHNPEISFRCGPFALGRILTTCYNGNSMSPTIRDSRSTTNGFSLVEVADLAAAMKMDYQMAKRSPGAAVIVPSVVNWKIGHYAALVKEEKGRYLVQDPTFTDDVWVSKAALDDQASGYFLVPAGVLPRGWLPVGKAEGGHVFGKGITTDKDPDRTKPCDCKVPPCKSCQKSGGSSPATPMAQYSFHTMLVSLNIIDTPVCYAPPRGPAVAFQVTYNQRDANQPSIFSYSNLGNKWTFGWLAYITDDASNPSANASYYVAGGGAEQYSGYNISSSSYTIDPDSHATLVRTSGSPIQYERRMPDGSKQIFNASDGGTTPRKVFLTSQIDPAGNVVTNIFDSSLRIVAVKDAIGQVTSLSYASTNTSDPRFYMIAKVTDPFGRFATFDYTQNGGVWQLTKITDIIGITSEFTYNGDFITSLKTPYGTTAFSFGESGTTRWLEATDPLGATEHLEYRDAAPGILASETLVPTPTSDHLNQYLNYRDSYYWDKKAWHDYPGNYTKAYSYHFLHHLQNANLTSGTIESEKPPLESRIWRNYDGQDVAIWFEGTNDVPSKIARVLDDGSTQLYRCTYNIYSKPLLSTDPSGRGTGYIYAANNMDLLEAYQMVSATTSNVLAKFTYNSIHLPLTVVDAAGNTTSFGYSTNGQLLAITNALNEVALCRYDTNGYLTNIVMGTTNSSLSTNQFTYDGYGRVQTVTDPMGYTVVTSYDAADRPTNITYMDGTYERVVYKCLDPVLQRDRNGHWTSLRYDQLRRLTDTYDNASRHTHFDWCNCGSLMGITDPLGNATAWVRDVQGRVTSKIYSDLTQINYTYEANTSRLKSVTDAKNQSAIYGYFGDDNLQQITYSNAVVATPAVSFTYDSYFNRLATMSDGTGVTTYRFYPFAAGQFGAGQLSSVSNSFIGSSSLVSYNYDALGRITNRAINGAVQQMTFDALHRVVVVTNVLGLFTNTYVGATMLISTNLAPFGKKTVFSYLSVSNDEHLAEILNQKTNGVTLSKFDYLYDADGQITNWTQQADAGTPVAQLMQYDPVNQLLNVTTRSNSVAGAILKQFAYGYDVSGNRTSEQVDNGVSRATFNNVNQLTSRTSGGGTMEFAGNISRQGLVTVAGNAVNMDHFTTNFVGYTSVTNGTNIVPVVAMDYGGHAVTNKYQVVVTNNGVAKTLAYDLNGNETNVVTATLTNSYQFDAANRLVQIISGTNQSLFTYDGLGRRVQNIEKTNGVAYLTNKFLWCGTELCEQRDLTGATVNKRFFGGGEQISGTNYYYTRDHRGSIREMVDSAGAIQARYDYDPYGRRTKVSGNLDADFGYVGMFQHAASGFNLTLYRAYDSDCGRWLSRDPLQEHGGMNLYAYVQNNPINAIDPLGLAPLKLDIFKLYSVQIAEHDEHCKTLAASINHMETLTDNALPSLSDVGDVFDNAEYMQDWALFGEFLYAVMGGGAAAKELHEFNLVRASRPVYNLGGVTASIVFGQAIEKASTDLPNNGFAAVSGINVLNPADTVAEWEEELGKDMSESTYQTIRGLQEQLANMMGEYRQDCPCKK